MAEQATGASGVAALAEADAPVFETLVQMTLDTFERSGLDQETYLLARIAALVAMDASAPSYLLNIGTAAEAGVSLEKIQGTLVAIAPVVGSARVVSAARAIGDAFGLELPGDKEQ
ncbi:carboxymuconolactone decarboxylase family protein [Streptomyces sp. AK04-3B]|uniref:carboxymuconolactone decarboxylase family protein n=1 Tax=unclassified Streptomyces TaxID=2593676 RepID=UPI0029B88217|nr:carboxymuconolactone decarboxylase family protein [Streptomyces sp. AK04-3B]MDX3801667.1 carboxymuconolactone decarboxylase family protein [Streptomyces sp. AK04-3B]